MLEVGKNYVDQKKSFELQDLKDQSEENKKVITDSLFITNDQKEEK